MGQIQNTISVPLAILQADERTLRRMIYEATTRPIYEGEVRVSRTKQRMLIRKHAEEADDTKAAAILPQVTEEKHLRLMAEELRKRRKLRCVI